jgi:rhodanese-related sulfurtransferase
MSVFDYFKPVSTWSAERLRAFLEKASPDEYYLVDVRQPAEYEREHLPGAQLIPLAKLASRAGELDPEKPVIAY